MGCTAILPHPTWGRCGTLLLWSLYSKGPKHTTKLILILVYTHVEYRRIGCTTTAILPHPTLFLLGES